MSKESSKENNESDGVTFEYLLTFSKECLAQGLLKCVKFKHDYISKIKALRKKNKILEFKNEILQKSYENLHT